MFQGQMQVGKEGLRGEIRLGCFRGKIKIRGFLGAKKRLGEKAS